MKLTMTRELKRIGAVLLTVAMTLSLVPFISEAAVAGFADVSRTAWYAPAVKYVHDNGIMEGVGNNRFDPNGGVTRGMAVQMIYNMEGRPAVNGRNDFIDVAPGAWYSRAVSWASGQGVVSGIGNKRFAPNAEVTREQMAVIFNKYCDWKGICALERKTDCFEDYEQVSQWALDALLWAYGVNIMDGDGYGYIHPHDTASRAEIAQMFMNFKSDIMENAVYKKHHKYKSVDCDVRYINYSTEEYDCCYALLQISDKSYPYADKINKQLKDEMDTYLKQNKYYAQGWQNDYSDYRPNGSRGLLSYDNNFIYTDEAGNQTEFNIYDGHGYLILPGRYVTVAHNIGDEHILYKPHVFDLDTGRDVTLSEFLNVSDSRAKKIFADDMTCNGFDVDQSYVDLNHVGFAVDSYGELNFVLNVGRYNVPGNGLILHAGLPTGYNIADLDFSDDSVSSYSDKTAF